MDPTKVGKNMLKEVLSSYSLSPAPHLTPPSVTSNSTGAERSYDSSKYGMLHLKSVVSASSGLADVTRHVTQRHRMPCTRPEPLYLNKIGVSVMSRGIP